MTLTQITDQLLKDLDGLRFGPPVTHVYNPLTYAGEAYARYLALYGNTPKEVLLLGMNPGPWGMAQTGVPFGEVRLVRDWLEIEVPITAPAATHPKRPVTGFACTRSEVSGARLWGWIRETFQTPERFFARFFVANYCPLIFIEASGRNRTPDHLPQAQRAPLLAACDRALRRSVAVLTPQYVVGVGRFAETRALEALSGLPVTIGRLTHPSPANPAANRGWAALAARELADLGIRLETPRDP
jgi:single-strand selective monofunctional uracil DNA glycosylase